MSGPRSLSGARDSSGVSDPSGQAPGRRGAELLRAVAAMDALRASGGDAWTAQQTHRSLARYLLEESHEVLEAIEAEPGGTGAGLVGELGDLLFQILFHARLGQEEDPAWDVDDVARAFVEKMERRNPHVFGERADEALADRADVEAIIAQWHAVKAAEKGRAPGADRDWFASIPQRLPALQTAAKAVHRARSAGALDELLAAADDACRAAGPEDADLALARDLLDLVVRAEARDHDPESALRTLLARTAARLDDGPGSAPAAGPTA